MSSPRLSRARIADLTLVALLALTAMTFVVVEHSGAASALAVLVLAKAALVGTVFLELDRAWPGWAVVGTLVVGGTLGGTWLLVG